MPRLRIKDAPLLPYIRGDEKIPTGGRGDLTLTPFMLKEWLELNNISGNTENIKKDDLPDIGYDNVQVDDRFGYSALQEVIDGFHGGSSYSKTPIEAPYIQKNMFRFFDLANQSKTPIPFQHISGAKYKIPFAAITATTTDLAFVLPDFQPVDSNGQANTSFKYVGEKPLYAELDGDFKLLVKLSEETTNITKTPYIWLNITAKPKPDFEYNESLTIGSDGWNETKELFKLDPSGYSVRNKTYQDYINDYELVKEVDYFTLKGYIPAESKNDLLLATDYERHLTTQWMTIPPSSKVLTSTDKEVTVFRIQVLFNDDTIGYFGNNISDANSLLSLPSNAKKWRVTYQMEEGQPEDLVAPVLTIKNVKNDDNYYSGYWGEYDFNFKTFYSFYPEYEYSFEIWMWDSKRVPTPYDFILNKGSLVIESNARRKLQKQYDEVVNNVV